MSIASSNPARRCDRHNLALSPQGECVVCRREAQSVQQPTLARRAEPLSKIWLPLSLLCLGVGGWFVFRHVPIQQQATNVSPGLSPEPRDRTDEPADPSFREDAKRTVVRESSEAIPERIAPSKMSATATAAPVPEHDTKVARRPQKPSKEELRVLERQVGVTLYTTSWCPHCRSARAYMREAGISFVEHDIDRDQSAKADMERLNPEGGVPTIDVDGIVMGGWSSRNLHIAMKQAALKRWKRNEGID